MNQMWHDIQVQNAWDLQAHLYLWHSTSALVTIFVTTVYTIILAVTLEIWPNMIMSCFILLCKHSLISTPLHEWALRTITPEIHIIIPFHYWRILLALFGHNWNVNQVKKYKHLNLVAVIIILYMYMQVALTKINCACIQNRICMEWPFTKTIIFKFISQILRQRVHLHPKVHPPFRQKFINSSV